MKKIRKIFLNPALFASILIFASFSLVVYAFTGPPLGCTPGTCSSPLIVDFENQTVSVNNAPTASGHIANKIYVDTALGAIDINDADSDPTNEIQTLSGVLAINNSADGNNITNLAMPVASGDASNKAYVDGVISAAGSNTSERGIAGLGEICYTKNYYQGNLGGSNGADDKCEAECGEGFVFGSLGETNKISLHSLHEYSWVDSSYNSCQNWSNSTSSYSGYYIRKISETAMTYSSEHCSNHNPLFCVFKGSSGNSTDPDKIDKDGDALDDYDSIAYEDKFLGPDGDLRGIDLDSSKYDAGGADQSGTIIYVSTFTSNGDFDDNNDGDARPEMDAFCSTYKPSGLQCNNIHAFVSLDSSDALRDMPANYGYNPYRPVYWYNQSSKQLSRLATDWTDMLDSTIEQAQNAGTGISNNVWTGNNPSGATSHNCISFTNTGGSSFYGSSSETNGNWLAKGVNGCNVSYPIRCACTP